MTTKPADARISQAEIKVIYDRMSKFYNLWARVAESMARQRALELADVKDGQSVLEVAVGTGLAFEEMVKRNAHGRNAGLDISEGMLSKAKQRLARSGKANYELKLGSAFDLPYPRESFDLLLNNYMFDLIPFEAMDRSLQEFWRVLKPGDHWFWRTWRRRQAGGMDSRKECTTSPPGSWGGAGGCRWSPGWPAKVSTSKPRSISVSSAFPPKSSRRKR